MGIWASIKSFLFDDRSIKEEFRAMIEADEAQKAAAFPTAVNDQITDSVTAEKPKRVRKPKAETAPKKATRKKKQTP